MENNILNENVQNAEFQIRDYLRGYYKPYDEVAFISATYILYKVSMQLKSDISFREVVDALDKEERLIIESSLKYVHDDTDLWNNLMRIGMSYAPAVFANILIKPLKSAEMEYRFERPTSIMKLLERILNIDKNDCVCDTACACGDTLIHLAQKYDCKLYGVEINTECKALADLRTKLLEKNITIEQNSFYTKVLENINANKYDKIVSFHPFGFKVGGWFSRYSGEWLVRNLNELLCNDLFKNSTSIDWAYAIAASKALKENGKALLLVSDGCLFNSFDEKIRKYFVEQGLLEAVISLPPKMFMSLGVNVSLMVISNNNVRTRLVNARNIFQSGRRQNTLSDKDVDVIFEAYKNGGKHTVEVTLEDISANMFSLAPERYMAVDSLDLNNAVPFEEIITSIGRTAPLTAKQLDEVSSEEPTDIRYIRLADIQNGMINEQLPYISAVDGKYEKYFLESNDIILSKNGYPFKVAIVNIKENEKILPVGNMYILKVDQKKVNLQYLKAFLESSKGIALLKSVVSGTTIPVINVAALQKMPIELPSNAVQLKIARKYQTISDEIEMLRIKLAKATEKLNHVMDEEDGD